MNSVDGINLFQIYADAGRTGILVTLAGQPVDQLKELCKKHSLDCSGSYKRYKDNRELAEFMAHRVKCMMTKGSAFMI